MTLTNVHLCSFSGGVMRLTSKQRKDPVAILRALRDDPRISTWDMVKGRPRLWRIIYQMVKDGLIVEVKEPYPWLRFELTDNGKALIEEVTHE